MQGFLVHSQFRVLKLNACRLARLQPCRGWIRQMSLAQSSGLLAVTHKCERLRQVKAEILLQGHIGQGRHSRSRLTRLHALVAPPYSKIYNDLRCFARLIRLDRSCYAAGTSVWLSCTCLSLGWAAVCQIRTLAALQYTVRDLWAYFTLLRIACEALQATRHTDTTTQYARSPVTASRCEHDLPGKQP